MDNEQAKFVLSAYRADGRDAQDPSFAEVLRQAENDPVLRRWLAEQRSFDESIAEMFEGVRPPATARACAVAAMRMTRRRRTRRAWGWPLAMAASIALAATITVAITQRSDRVSLPQVAAIESLAGYLAEHHASIGLMSEDYSSLVQWIRSRGGPVPANLPAALENLPVLGCQTWDTNRGKVSLVCFVGSERKMVHLYVFEDAGSLEGDLPAVGRPRIERHGMWAMAAWQDAGRGYVLGVPAEGDPAAAVAPFVHA